MRACCVTQGRKWCGGRRCDARHVVRGHRRGASWPVTGAQPRWDDLFQAMLNLEATAANEMRILTEIYIYIYNAFVVRCLVFVALVAAALSQMAKFALAIRALAARNSLATHARLCIWNI